MDKREKCFKDIGSKLFFLIILLSNTVLNAQYATNNKEHFKTRYIIVFRAGINFVYGTFYININNTTKLSRLYKKFIMIPKESIEFSAQKGVTNKDIEVAPDGGLFVEKVFKKGVSDLVISFKVPILERASFDISLRPKEQIDDLGIYITKNSKLNVSSDGLNAQEQVKIDKYNLFVFKDSLMANKSYQLRFSGFAESRYNYWILGIITALVLLILVPFLVSKTRATVEN